MAALIDQLRPVQKGVPAHQATQIADIAGQLHPIAWWFEQPTRDFMMALSLRSNNLIVPGNPATSRFVTSLTAPTGPMGAVFDGKAEPPNSGSCRDVLVMWIQKGCPLPDLTPKTLRLNTFASVRDTHPTGRILGMGTIH
jgi:hypothetical protein